MLAWSRRSTARRSRRSIWPLGGEALQPARRAGDADPDGRLAAALRDRPSDVNRLDRRSAKIVRLRHPRRLLRAAEIINHNSTNSKILTEFSPFGYRFCDSGAMKLISKTRSFW